MQNKKTVIVAHTECNEVHRCANNRCIYRLQSVFGLNYFQQHENFEEVLLKAGVSYAEYPKFEFITKSGGIVISCPNYSGGGQHE